MLGTLLSSRRFLGTREDTDPLPRCHVDFCRHEWQPMQMTRDGPCLPRPHSKDVLAPANRPPPAPDGRLRPPGRLRQGGSLTRRQREHNGPKLLPAKPPAPSSRLLRGSPFPGPGALRTRRANSGARARSWLVLRWAGRGAERFLPLGSCAQRRLFQIPVPIVTVSLATMDLRNSATLESVSNAIIRPSLPRPLKHLYRGEPMALGITQTLIGILETAFGLVTALARRGYFSDHHVTIPYWLAFLYIISGSLSVAAAKNPKLPLVKGMLGMNIVSAVAAGIAIVLLSISVNDSSFFYISCNDYHTGVPPQVCHELDIAQASLHNVLVILLVFTILEFLIATTSAGFGCSSLCRNSYSETTVVIFQNTAGLEAPPVLPTSIKEDEVP